MMPEITHDAIQLISRHGFDGFALIVGRVTIGLLIMFVGGLILFSCGRLVGWKP